MKRAEVVRDYGGVSAADRRDERRRKLVAAGRRIWGEGSVSDVTVRGVCSAAGLTPRYFYEHFTNREALIFAIADDVRDQLLGSLVSVSLADPGPLADKVRSGLTAFLDAAAADPHIHRILTGDISSVPGLTEHRVQVIDVIADLIIRYAPDILGAETPDPAVLRRGALFLVGGVNRIIDDWLLNPVETTAELAAQCTALCMITVEGALKLGPTT
ncbi:transcriptional regulator [Mycobacteroides sp. H001]|uniref:TetR/AcrR family transcriptional regulator n=1 Tax=Mycobacteroides TaxID=670516 RepID=UPI000714A7D3|nr:MULTISPECIES: TetR/AcrR family transcriptional regulator [Mycobacteroides]KRQ26469.1 transcriptional regulator [Mycobacteroides sp. H072]KRQ32669.1 transcriptional regulator [Mycobacteroides sp. H002]KRQ54095.1 transcriptional regulator [Mycobacteroides sp. H054]KRQ67965.1 transcriptional regulator [Mycobacteroides sp. H001]OHU42879.1 TetR family transcriptional regulator [Mycobacteroides chelonae]